MVSYVCLHLTLLPTDCRLQANNYMKRLRTHLVQLVIISPGGLHGIVIFRIRAMEEF